MAYGHNTQQHFLPAMSGLCCFYLDDIVEGLNYTRIYPNQPKIWIKILFAGIIEFIGTASELGICGEITIFIFNFLILILL